MNGETLYERIRICGETRRQSYSVWALQGLYDSGRCDAAGVADWTTAERSRKDRRKESCQLPATKREARCSGGLSLYSRSGERPTFSETIGRLTTALALIFRAALMSA